MSANSIKPIIVNYNINNTQNNNNNDNDNNKLKAQEYYNKAYK